MVLASALKSGAEFSTLGLVPAKGEVGGCLHLPSPSFSFLPLVSSVLPIPTLSLVICVLLALPTAPKRPAWSNELLRPNPVEFAL